MRFIFGLYQCVHGCTRKSQRQPKSFSFFLNLLSNISSHSHLLPLNIFPHTFSEYNLEVFVKLLCIICSYSSQNGKLHLSEPKTSTKISKEILNTKNQLMLCIFQLLCFACTHIYISFCIYEGKKH